MTKRPTIEQACRQYVHRFTMDHVPLWALKPRPDGHYYAPQFASDRQWYEHTKFPGEAGHIGDRKHCFTTGCTWPLGQSLSKPFHR